MAHINILGHTTQKHCQEIINFQFFFRTIKRIEIINLNKSPDTMNKNKAATYFI